MLGLDDRPRAADGPERRPGGACAPRPRVAEPEGRQQVERHGLRTAIGGRDPDQDVVDAGLGILDHHVPVAVLVEHPRVQQFVLRRAPIPPPVLLDEQGVREGVLRILVEVLHVGVRRRGVEVEVVLLHVLAVIALAAGDTEEPLLHDRIAAVPEREREAQPLVVVRDAGQAILSPAIGPGARVLVGEELPGGPVRAVVLPDRAPLPLGHVRAPPLPVRGPLPRLLESPLLRRDAPPLHARHWATLLRHIIRTISPLASPSGFDAHGRIAIHELALHVVRAPSPVPLPLGGRGNQHYSLSRGGPEATGSPALDRRDRASAPRGAGGRVRASRAAGPRR